MPKTVRLADVARAAGVSQGTASNVFNRPDLVRGAIRARVEAAARDLGYAGPDPKGRLLRAGKVHAIGVVVNERLAMFLEDPGDLIMLTGIAEICDARGSGMALVSAYPDDQTPAWTIRSAVVDGFIVFCLEEGDRLIDETRRRNLPFVTVDVGAGPDVSSVRVDDRAGARLAAEHLLGLGHRRIGILSLELIGDGHFGPVEPARRRAARYVVTRERLEGYAEGLAEAGIDMDSVPIMEVLHERGHAAAATAMLLSDAPDVTAILGMTDLLALGVLDHARATGLDVPGRLSVVGFDDIPAAAAADPPLTTLAQPIREKGRLAARLLFEEGPPRTELLKVELVLRGSTGPARDGAPALVGN